MIHKRIRFLGEAALEYYLAANEYFSVSYSTHFNFSHCIGGDVYWALRWAASLGKELAVTTIREEGIRGDELVMQLDAFNGNNDLRVVPGYRHNDIITVHCLHDGRKTVFSRGSNVPDSTKILAIHKNDYLITAGLFDCIDDDAFHGTVILRDPYDTPLARITLPDICVCTPSIVRHFTSLSGLWDACHEWYDIIKRDFFVVSNSAEVYYMRAGELSLYEPPAEINVCDPALAFGIVAGLRHHEERLDDWVYSIIETMCGLPTESDIDVTKSFLPKR